MVLLGVAQYFNPEGIIFLDEGQPWNNIPWDKLTYEYYESKKEISKKTLKLLLNMRVAEDYLYQNYFVQLDPQRSQRIKPL